MIVHADEPGNNGAAGKIQSLRAGGNFGCAVAGQSGDFSVLDDECLIRAGRRPRAIDDAHVRQREHGRIFPDKCGDSGRKLRIRLTYGDSWQ